MKTSTQSPTSTRRAQTGENGSRCNVLENVGVLETIQDLVLATASFKDEIVINHALFGEIVANLDWFVKEFSRMTSRDDSAGR